MGLGVTQANELSVILTSCSKPEIYWVLWPRGGADARVPRHNNTRPGPGAPDPGKRHAAAELVLAIESRAF